MLPTSSKVTSRTLLLAPTVKFPETIWTRPQYTPGEPHGNVAEVTTVEEVTPRVIEVELETDFVDEGSAV